MKSFPLFLDLEDARVVIVGGGEAAAQKIRLIARTPARITVMATELTDELTRSVQSRRIAHAATVLDPEEFQAARIVIIATGCAALDGVAADLARAAGAIVNVVDRPALSDATMPSIVDRSPVVVAIGTEGTAPVLARQIKTQVEEMLEPTLGSFASTLGRLRSRVAYRIAPGNRRRFWEWVMQGPRQLFTGGDRHSALAAMEQVIETGEIPDTIAGRVTIVSVGAGEADLLTLRAVARLQTADIILHDADCPLGILDLARRDGERHVICPPDGPDVWRLENGSKVAKAAAAEGRQVVWLIDDAVQAASRIGDLAEIIQPAQAGAPSPVIARAKDG